MIRARKILSNFFLNNQNLHTFASSQVHPRFKILEQKAYLASKIIQKIGNVDIYCLQREQNQELKHKFYSEVRKYSLSEAILQMIQQEKTRKNLTGKAVNDMESFFTTGVNFDRKAFDEQTILSSPFGNDDYCGDFESKIKFFPTYTVTSNVFDEIINRRFSTAYWDERGISKSISIMLYSMLSGIVVKYHMQTFGQQSQLKPQIKKFPKLLYYRYKPENMKDVFSVYNDLTGEFFRQCSSDLPKNFKRTNMRNFVFIQQRKGTDNKIKNLKQYYAEKDIEIKSLIDNFDQHISLCRRLRYLTSWYRHTTPKQFDQAQYLEKYRYKFAQLLDMIRYNVGILHFLSPVHLKPLIRSTQDIGNQGNHTQVIHGSFSYINKLKKEITIYQIVDSFLFLIQQCYQIKFTTKTTFRPYNIQKSDSDNQKHTQTLHILQKSTYLSAEEEQANLFQKLRKSLVDELYKYQGRHLLTFYVMKLTIQQCMEEFGPKLLKQLQEKSFLHLTEFAKELLHKAIAESKKQIKIRITNFIGNKKIVQQKFSQSLQKYFYLAACRAIQFQQDSFSEQRKMPVLKKEKIQSFSQKLLPQLSASHLIQDVFSQLQCRIPAYLLIQVLNQIIDESLYFPISSQLFYFYEYSNYVGLEKLLVKMFIQMVLEASAEIEITLGNDEKNKQLLLVNKRMQKFAYNSKPQFDLPQAQQDLKQPQNSSEIDLTGQKTINSLRSKSYNFKKQFKSFFQSEVRFTILKNIQKKAPLNLKDTYLFVPSTQLNSQGSTRQQTGELDRDSKCIDFVLVDLNFLPNSKPEIIFNAFSIVKSSKEVLDKISNFAKQFCCFEDRNENQVQIQLLDQKITAQTRLNYFALGPGTYNQNLTNQLNKDSESYLKFISFGGSSDVCSVECKSSRNSMCFLEKVGFLSIGKTLKVSKRKSNKSIQKDGAYGIWKKIEQQFEYRNNRK